MRRPRPQPPSTATTAATNVASLASEATAGTDLAAPGGDDVLPLAGVPYGDDAAAGPPTPIRAAPVRAGGDIRPPVKLRHVPPVYPELARVARIEGHVVLECTIGPEGRIVEVTILSGPPLLRTAAAEAVRQWLYRPTLLNEVAVPVVMTVTVHFTLSR
jgi:protein TonB